MRRERMLVIVAHVGDFIWRAGGAIARYIQDGHDVHVIALSYGVRGESNLYWKRIPNSDPKDCAAARKEEGMHAAHLLGLNSIEFSEYEDYPLLIDDTRLTRLAKQIESFHPDFILTHDQEDDSFNTDHNLVSLAVQNACAMVEASRESHIPLFGLEPHNPEICNFHPQIYIDITDVMKQKSKAMDVMISQSNMAEYYIQKALMRATQALARGKIGCKYAEAFTFFYPIAAHGKFVW